MELTKDTSKLAVVLYKLYLQKKKFGDMEAAISFDSRFYVGIKELEDCSPSLINFSLNELKEHALISENILGDIKLKTDFIKLMENRFNDRMDSVLSFLKDLTSGIVSNLILLS